MLNVFFPQQVGTRVFFVWAYHDVDDASNPRMFSMHTRKSHTNETYEIISAMDPMISTRKLTLKPTTRTSVLTTNTKSVKFQKSVGFQPGASFLSNLIITVLSILVK